MQSGYYSWVCYKNTQSGAWFGPINQSKVSDYERGFGLDSNIKSFTNFQYYDDKPSFNLGCNFNMAIDTTAVAKLEEIIQTFGKLLEEANADSAEPKGSCKYPVGIGGTYCQSNITKAQCDKFTDSTWTENGRCP
jgi:hypothetical protein